jgi:hypothetical protein
MLAGVVGLIIGIWMALSARRRYAAAPYAGPAAYPADPAYQAPPAQAQPPPPPRY